MPQIARLCKRPERRIGIVTHGGVIRSVCARILETDQKNKLKFALDLENTSLTHLLYDEARDLFCGAILRPRWSVFKLAW